MILITNILFEIVIKGEWLIAIINTIITNTSINTSEMIFYKISCHIEFIFREDKNRISDNIKKTI